MKHTNFYNETIRLQKLHELGDQLEKLNICIKSETLREILINTLKKESQYLGIHLSFDYLMMKIFLILQMTIQNFIHEREYRNHLQLKKHEIDNTKKSQIRVKMKHTLAAIIHFI